MVHANPFARELLTNQILRDAALAGRPHQLNRPYRRVGLDGRRRLDMHLAAALRDRLNIRALAADERGDPPLIWVRHLEHREHLGALAGDVAHALPVAAAGAGAPAADNDEDDDEAPARRAATAAAVDGGACAAGTCARGAPPPPSCCAGVYANCTGGDDCAIL